MRVLSMVLFLMCVGVISGTSQTNLAKQYFDKGSELAKAKKHEKAIEFYESSLKIAKKDKKLKAKIQYNIGACFYQLRRFDRAESAFKRAIKTDSKYVQAIYSLGLAQIELKKMGFAEANFRKVIGLDEKHAEAWFDLGMVLFDRKMFGNAKISFQKAIEHKTTRSAEAQNNLGAISAMQGDIEAAEVQFRKALVQSKGTLLLAKKNIEFCRKIRRSELSNRLAIK